ncbi:helix-turn-helix domain-containing protein [Alcaligenaceae bacterium]|nr:helix-turn-helix domain-containing protein [Alcaligenaceae bacterium]
MSGPSDWPLPKAGVRFIVPQYLLDKMQKNTLTRGLYIRAAGYYPNAAGHHVSRSAHADDLLLYCMGGEGCVQVNGVVHPVTKGSLIMLPKGVAHSYGASLQQPWTMYWIHFSGLDVAAFWQHLGFCEERPVSSIGLAPRFTSDFQILMQIGTTDFLENSLVYGANLLRQMLSLVRVMQHQNIESRSRFSLDAIHELMYESLHMDLDLDMLAQAANMSRAAFCRRYKTVTGTSPYKHYLYLKMERACQLLGTTDQSVARVAELMGYSDTYYFSRIFRNMMGMPPSQYRAKRYG